MGKTDLGKWMITNGGEYSADATYEQLTMVKYGNSTYITLKTVTGITPTDDKINYQLMAQGFDATALSAVQAEDTQGLCGEKGEIVTAQSLVDALADKVMNTVMAKIGTAALTGGMTDLSSGVSSLYSKLGMGTDLSAGDAENVTQAVNALYSNLGNILPFNNTIKDFNDAASFGIYCGLNLINSPRKGHITVLTIPIGSGRSGNSGYCRQLAFPVSSNTIYARYRDDGVWKAWVTLHS